METVIDTPDLRIAHRPGGDGEAVLAFAGVQGAFGGVPVAEFAASLAKAAVHPEVWFVIDKTRSWYNRTAETIVDILAPRLAGRRVVTLGNSMGGFGALLFGGRLDAAVAVAFCPQYSIDRRIAPFEERWDEFIAAIDDIRYPVCLAEDASADCRRLVFVGDRQTADLNHARLIRAHMAAADGVFVVRNCRHDVAQVLKQQGLLAPVLEAAMAADRDAVATCLKEGGVAYDLWRNQGSTEASKSG